MPRLRKEALDAISGAQLRNFAFQEDELYRVGNPAKMVGRASGFNEDDRFPAFPLEEVGCSGIDEHVYGQHNGSFTLGKFLGRNLAAEKYLPARDENRTSFHDLKTLTFIRIITHGKLKGTWVDKYRRSKCVGRGGGQNARGLIQGQTRWVYSFHNWNPDLIIDDEAIIEELPATGPDPFS